jgi:hypothetical protein
MLKHDPRWPIRWTQELMSKSQELYDRSRRAIDKGKRLQERLGFRHAKSGERRKHGVDITRNR